ncbi:MAG TPA: T9SS type A sorting domain-containing protein, partial [Cytophagales bacterium]|nr:T9SS type A sorting domain-containing protein [Cytophagales bacterium]
GQTFVIANRNGIVDLHNNLHINGNYSKLIVPEGQSFRINTGVDFQGQIEINNNSTLYFSGSSLPSFAKIDSTSTLVLGGNYVLPNSLSVGNLDIASGQLTLSADTTKILGDLKLGSGSTLIGNGSVVSLKGDFVSSDTNFTLTNCGLYLKGGSQSIDAKSGTLTVKSFVLKSGTSVAIRNSSKIQVTGSNTQDKVILENNSALILGTGQLILNGQIALNPNNETGYIATNGGSIKISSTASNTSYLRLSTANLQNYLEYLYLNNASPSTKLELKSPVYIKNTLDLRSGAFKTNNNLVLLTDYENSSRILKINSNVTFQDSITYYNYIGPFKKQGSYNIATPIKNRPMKEWKSSFYIRTGTSGGIPVSYLRTFREGDGLWESIVDTATILTPGVGFNLYIPQSTFTSDAVYSSVSYFNFGYPVIGNGNGNHNGDFSIPVNKTNSNGGWNLVANPYPCELDWDQSSGWDKSDISNIVYFWDGNTSKYLSYDGNTHTSLNGANSKIPSGQGFMVRKNNQGSGLLKINESAKVGVKPDYRFYRKAQQEQLYKLFITLANDKGYGDQAALVFGDDYASEYDGMDQAKLLGQVLNVYSVLEDKNLVLQCLPKQYAGVIPLGISATKGNFVLNFSDESLFDKLESLYLVDRYTNTAVDLIESPTYNFAVTADIASYGNTRFILNYTFEAPVVTHVNDHHEHSHLDVFPNPFTHHLTIHVKSKSDDVAHLHITDVSGRELYSGVHNLHIGENLIDAQELVDFKSYGKGIYILKVVTDTKTISTKLIYK